MVTQKLVEIEKKLKFAESMKAVPAEAYKKCVENWIKKDVY